MRTLLFLLFSGIISLCFINYSSDKTSRNTYISERNDSLEYKVYKLDSINNYYIIYAKREYSFYKIISRKESTINCAIISVGKTYKFNLNSFLVVNGHRIIPANQINELSGWRVDSVTTIKFENDLIRDLFYADNIKGLCYLGKN